MTNKEAIEELKSHKSDGGWGFMCGECPCDCKTCETSQALDLAIKALEAQGWIPVTERLPESTDDVLVTDKYDMFVAWYANSWHSSDYVINENTTPIVAWMPLPEPYTKEETT